MVGDPKPISRADRLLETYCALDPKLMQQHVRITEEIRAAASNISPAGLVDLPGQQYKGEYYGRHSLSTLASIYMARNKLTTVRTAAALGLMETAQLNRHIKKAERIKTYHERRAVWDAQEKAVEALPLAPLDPACVDFSVLGQNLSFAVDSVGRHNNVDRRKRAELYHRIINAVRTNPERWCVVALMDPNFGPVGLGFQMRRDPRARDYWTLVALEASLDYPIVDFAWQRRTPLVEKIVIALNIQQ